MKPVPAAAGIDVWASEEAWAQQFMATKAFRQFVAEVSDLSVTALVFTPENISLTCFTQTDQLETATVSRWIRFATDLAAAAEAHPPQHRAQRTWLERQPRRTRVAILVAVLFGAPLLLLGMFGACILAVIVTLSVLF